MSATLVRRNSRLLFLAVSAVLAAGTASAQTSRSGASTATLDEVVVSAQKRNENLQTVPVSITALSGEQLQELQINSGTEIARQTPNLRVSNLGNEDQPKFSMRGIATPDFNLNTTSPTGIFYDEVYVASQFLGGPQIFDLERVEVLRGPQGTLFGKNTTGGAVNFITHAPTYKSEGYVSVEAGNNNYFHAQGALNMPLVDDKLATRVAFNSSKSDGWIKNYNPAGQDLSSINNYALRWSFLYEPTDSFDATLRLLHSRSNPTNIGVIAYGTAPCAGGGGNNCNAAGVNPRKNPANGQDFNAWEGYYDRVGGEIKADGDGGILTLNQKMGDLTLTSITSYMKGDFKNNVDADGSIASLIHIDFYAQTKEFGEDLRLSSKFDGAFNFIAGLYYFGDDTDIQTNYFMFGNTFNPAQSYTQSRTSFAAYADMTYDFTATWTGYGGVRWTDDHGEVNDFRVVPTIPLQPRKEYDDSAPTGRLGVRHKFSNDVMGYAQYSRGYRSSSINGSALTNASDFNVADPEYLDALEVGFKSQWLDHRLQINSSAFYYRYTDQQFVNAITLTESKMVNAGKSQIYGLEIETAAQVTENFRATVGIALLETEYLELDLSRVPVGSPPGTLPQPYNLAGNELIEAPHFSLNMALDYSLPVGGGRVGFHVDGVYMTSMYYTPWNDLPPSNLSVTPSQWEANARIGYRPTGGNFEIAAWGKNLNANDVAAGQVGADQSTFFQRFTVSPYPRRYGVEFNYNF
jgi:iron complex outermembrane receptor protein